MKEWEPAALGNSYWVKEGWLGCGEVNRLHHKRIIPILPSSIPFIGEFHLPWKCSNDPASRFVRFGEQFREMVDESFLDPCSKTQLDLLCSNII